MQQRSQQQMQQLQGEAQAALDRQAESMHSVRHVSNTAMQRLADKHSQQMERLRARLQQDTGKEDQLHQQIVGCGGSCMLGAAAGLMGLGGGEWGLQGVGVEG